LSSAMSSVGKTRWSSAGKARWRGDALGAAPGAEEKGLGENIGV
jgi:hypothetical protein